MNRGRAGGPIASFSQSLIRAIWLNPSSNRLKSTPNTLQICAIRCRTEACRGGFVKGRPPQDSRPARVLKPEIYDPTLNRHRIPRSTGTGLPGSLGSALGRHAHPWHYQAAGRRDVRRGAAGLAAAARRTFPLLPIWRTHSAPGRLCGSRSGLLWCAAGLDRTTCQCAVGRLVPNTAWRSIQFMACLSLLSF